MKTCKVIRAGESYAGKQGLSYFAGVSAETVGSSALCMHLLRLPPGARASAHLHEKHESAVYVLEGSAGMLFGPSLEEDVRVSAGDFVYIPPGVPHLPYNPTDSEVVAVIARTDPNEQESVVLLPELDALAAGRLSLP